MARTKLPLLVAGKIEPERYPCYSSSSRANDLPKNSHPSFDFHVFLKYTEERSKTLDVLPSSRLRGLVSADLKALRCPNPRKEAIKYNGLIVQWDKTAADMDLRRELNIHHISMRKVPVGAQVEIESSSEHGTQFKIVSPSHLTGDPVREDSRSDTTSTLVDDFNNAPPRHLDRQTNSQKIPGLPEKPVYSDPHARVDPQTRARVQKLTRELWESRREMQAAHARSDAVSRELDRLGAPKSGRPEDAWENMAEASCTAIFLYEVYK
ncbi:hypothetical protein CONPUDRAFT_159013 [Coniophora puteana RWD-64-598 SS2]|uniref:Uncharacterized protein n=1 Tax=Coniophora puteana (strain RWD-64-598) TaxID=741705 RepID=A0A5M3M8H4_CONPW|nr:uncharacterized protein CONPUDRAFT_159013 [Coniophora puteana RWD-64-598 SS2]EIW75562.1 hypothetical protein CONPUDRAFT_159013 [Coniophora puteana RWD-64-598 SS2]